MDQTLYIEGTELTGIEEAAPIEGLTVLPNPTYDRFALSFNLLEAAKIRIDMVDVAGKHVGSLYTGTHGNGMFNQQFDTNALGLTPGIYLLNISVDQAMVTRKLVVTQ